MSSVLEAFVARARAGRLTTSKHVPHLLYPPADQLSVVVAECRLRFRLPALLRGLYIHVGNGGFGPGYGLFGLAGGACLPTNPVRSYLVELYRDCLAGRHSDMAWRERMLPVCHWGRTWFSCLDCSAPQAPVLDVDIGARGRGIPPSDFVPQAPSFESWLQRFLDGDDLRPRLDRDGAPREPDFGIAPDMPG